MLYVCSARVTHEGKETVGEKKIYSFLMSSAAAAAARLQINHLLYGVCMCVCTGSPSAIFFLRLNPCEKDMDVYLFIIIF